MLQLRLINVDEEWGRGEDIAGMEGLIPLNELRPGERGVVKAFMGEPGQKFRLMEMGVLPGTAVRFVRRAPMGDPLEVEIRGSHLSLRVSEAACIGVGAA